MDTKKEPVRELNCSPKDRLCKLRVGNILLTLVFVAECKRGLVAYFRRTEVLDGTGVDVASVHGPIIALSGKLLERCAVKTYKSLLDYGLVGTVAVFDVHHHGDWNTAGNPLYSRLNKVAD